MWVADPCFIDFTAWREKADGLTDLDNLPADALLLTARCPGFRRVDLAAASVWAGASFALWRAEGGWAVPLAVGNPNGLEGTPSDPFFWIGKGETTVEVLAARPGEVTLVGLFAAGPSRSGGGPRRLSVHSGDCAAEVVADGRCAIRVPVPAGRSIIRLQALDQPTVEVLPNGDTRPLLLGVRDLSFQFRPN